MNTMKKEWAKGMKSIRGNLYTVTTVGKKTVVKPLQEAWVETVKVARPLVNKTRVKAKRAKNSVVSASRVASQVEWKELMKNLKLAMGKHIKTAKKKASKRSA